MTLPSSDTRPLYILYRTDRKRYYSTILSHGSVSDMQLILGSELVVQVVSALLRGNWQDFN